MCYLKHKFHGSCRAFRIQVHFDYGNRSIGHLEPFRIQVHFGYGNSSIGHTALRIQIHCDYGNHSMGHIALRIQVNFVYGYSAIALESLGLKLIPFLSRSHRSFRIKLIWSLGTVLFY